MGSVTLRLYYSTADPKISQPSRSWDRTIGYSFDPNPVCLSNLYLSPPPTGKSPCYLDYSLTRTLLLPPRLSLPREDGVTLYR